MLLMNIASMQTNIIPTDATIHMQYLSFIIHIPAEKIFPLGSTTT